MRKLLRSTIAAAVLGFTAPAGAHAVEVFNWTGCGGQNFNSCATVIANWDAGTSLLTFSVQNVHPVAGWPGSISAVGWDGLGTHTQAGSDASGWEFQDGPPGPGNPIGLGFNGFLAPGHPAGGMFAGDPATTFVIHFAVAPSFTSFTFGLREIGFEDDFWGDLNCETSNRLLVTKTGDQYSTNTPQLNDDNRECFDLPDDPPTEIVPEPATMVLLATGLIGLAGAQVRRRKNNKT